MQINATLNPQCNVGDCLNFGVVQPFVNNLYYITSKDTQSPNSSEYRIFWSTIGAPTVVITEVPFNTADNIPYIEEISISSNDTIGYNDDWLPK